jgi:hypothetical protein
MNKLDAHNDKVDSWDYGIALNQDEDPW